MTEIDFTREDLDSLVAWTSQIQNYREFVLRRFADFTHSNFDVRDASGRKVEPVNRDTFPRDCAGYGTWSIPGDAGLNAKDVEGGTVIVQHYMADDRGGSGSYTSVEMPLDFVFGERERDERHEMYLKLKAEFEPQG